MVNDGVHPALPRDSYDALELVNFSTLKVMAKSPAHYRHGLIEAPQDTDPKKLGRVVHVAVFEPERFRNMVAVWDGNARRGKDWDAFCERNVGKELLTEAEYEKCVAIQKAVRADVRAMSYVEGGQGEVSMLWTLAVTNAGVNNYSVKCKGRIDFDAAAALVDLKSTRDASIEGFARQAWNLKYHVQAAWYVDGYAKARGVRKPYRIVAVENEAPHVVQVYRVTDEHLRLGREEYSLWLDRLAECRRVSRWPAYADDEIDLELPRWLRPGDEDLSELGLAIGGD